MQNTIPVPHSVGEMVWIVVAIILASVGGGGFVAAWNLFLNRRKPTADIHEVEARTAKTIAESRSLELQSNISAGDAVLRMVQQLTFAQIANDKLHEENERLANENERYETQMRRAKALLKLHNIRFDE